MAIPLDQDMLYVDECCGQKVHFEGLKMKESDLKLLCVLLMNQIYNDIRMIVRERTGEG